MCRADALERIRVAAAVRMVLPGEPTVKDGGRWGMAVPDYDGGGWNKDFVFHGGWERYAPMPTRTAHL